MSESFALLVTAFLALIALEGAVIAAILLKITALLKGGDRLPWPKVIELLKRASQGDSAVFAEISELLSDSPDWTPGERQQAHFCFDLYWRLIQSSVPKTDQKTDQEPSFGNSPSGPTGPTGIASRNHDPVDGCRDRKAG